MDAIAKILSALGFGEYALIIIALSVFIDINPKIKFNPIKSACDFIGKRLNKSIEIKISEFKKEVDNKFNEQNEKFDQLQAEQKAQRETLNSIVAEELRREISTLRWDIINFENSIVNNVKHSREQYRHILDSGKKFKRMIQSSEPYVMIDQDDISKIEEAIKFIETHYESHRIDQSAMYF